jgi:hypothetical protein
MGKIIEYVARPNTEEIENVYRQAHEKKSQQYLL